MKIIEKIREVEGDNRVFFSFEYFPPQVLSRASEKDALENVNSEQNHELENRRKLEQKEKLERDLEQLYNRMGRMVAHGPLFCDVTWRPSTAGLILDVCKKAQNLIGAETMMHLTCLDMTVADIDYALDTIKSYGLQNVLALRGDPPTEKDRLLRAKVEDVLAFSGYPPSPSDVAVTEKKSFSSGLELVRHIRSRYGDYFNITVAAYPEGHPDVVTSEDGVSEEEYEKELAYLKEKVDAGADMIITQLFYDTDIFLKFVKDCRQIGITCPIVPGIMPIGNIRRINRMKTECKIKVPDEITRTLESIKDQKEAVKAYGVQVAIEMCRKLRENGIKFFHIYTFNEEESTLAIVAGLLDQSKRVPESLPSAEPVHLHLNGKMSEIEQEAVSA